MPMLRNLALLCSLAVSAAFAQPGADVAHTVLYVDPHGTLDLVAQVNMLFDACGHACEVHIPAGNYMVKGGTIRMHYGTESLSGDGKDKVSITYGGHTFLDWRVSATDDAHYFRPAGTVSGFSVACGSATAVCLSVGSVNGAMLEDLNLYGPAGDAEAIVFQNDDRWMERWTLRRINVYGFRTALHFKAPVGKGTDSFGYGMVDGVYTNQGAGQTGVRIDQGAGVYHQLRWAYQFNANGTHAEDAIFDVSGVFDGLGMAVTGENAGAPYTLFHVRCGAYVRFNGSTAVFGSGTVQTDCPSGPGAQYPVFYVSADAGAGAEQNAQGAPPLSGYAGTSDTYAVHPTMVSRPGGNGSAVTGVLSRADGHNTLYFGFDGVLPLCFSTHNPFLSVSDLHAVWCTDGGGNTHQNGGFAADGPVRTSSYFEAGGRRGITQDVDTGRCVLHVQAGLIVGTTCR